MTWWITRNRHKLHELAVALKPEQEYTQADLTELIGLSRFVLREWRQKSQSAPRPGKRPVHGPKWRLVGSTVLYRGSDVIAWLTGETNGMA